MKRISVALFYAVLLSLTVFAQAGRVSRPRVVTPPPPTNQTNNQTSSTANNQTQTKKPPVLIGDTKNTNSTAKQDDSTNAVEDDEVIRVETNLVTIPVSVLDRDGRFVSGLRQTDFSIAEDGVEQKVEYFASVEQPFTVILMIDVSNSTQFKIEEIQDAAIAFVNQLRRDDRVMVMSFDERVHVLSPATNNRYVLRDAIQQTNFGGGTSLYEAVDSAINRELKQIQGRKAIVLFTDGVDTTSKRATYQTTVREAEELDALIYPIRYDTFGDMQSRSGGSNTPYPSNNGGGIIGAILGGIFNGGGNIRIGNGGGGNSGGGTTSGTSRAEYERGARYLADLARTSGGRLFEARNSSNLDNAFAGIAEELRRQYSIGYYPETVGQNGQRKQIKVRVNRANAVVRAKNSYIVGGKQANNNAATTTTKQQPKLNSSRLPF